MLEPIIIAQSKFDGNTFFIFRENGIEVKVTIDFSKWFANLQLTKQERDYVRENLLFKKHEKDHGANIIGMHLQGHSDKFIADKNNMKEMTVSQITRNYWQNKTLEHKS